jgi:signal transduction histidine kinase
MAVGVAHDLNNYLSAIVGNNGIVLRNLPAGSSVLENVQEIEVSALSAVELTQQIILFAGRARLDRQEVDLGALLQDKSGKLAGIAGSKIAIKYQIENPAPRVKADPDLLDRLVTNLVENAREAIRDQDGIIRVLAGYTECDRACLASAYVDDNLPAGRYAYIEVYDSGRGMAADVQEKIFDPFFTTKLRGRGMGLPVVIGIARAHRGAIFVQSQPGHGSSFRVLLPV